MSNEAIGWSDCKLLAQKIGKLLPMLVHYVAGRSGDDYALRLSLIDLERYIREILLRTTRDNDRPGKVTFPEHGWSTGPVPGNTYVLIRTSEHAYHVARFVGNPGVWEVDGFEKPDLLVEAWKPI